MEIAALIISALGVLGGLVTLSLVLRNEFRERRRDSPVVWGFHRYATAEVHGQPCEAAELVQYGRMPTHLINYTPVGWTPLLKESYRVRRFVRAEDTMPLLLTDVDETNSWLLLAHCPRDDRRFTYFHYVDLDPVSNEYEARLAAGDDALRKKHKTIKGRLQRWRWNHTRGSIVRPVGPDGYPWARIRIDRGKRDVTTDVERIASIAMADGGESFTPY